MTAKGGKVDSSLSSELQAKLLVRKSSAKDTGKWMYILYVSVYVLYVYISMKLSWLHVAIAFTGYTIVIDVVCVGISSI